VIPAVVQKTHDPQQGQKPNSSIALAVLTICLLMLLTNLSHLFVNARTIGTGNGISTPTERSKLLRSRALSMETGRYISVNFDKTTYQQGDVVHISGEIITTDCTWDYTATNKGIAINISIHDPYGSLILSALTNPTVASYGEYSYDYALSANAAVGTYQVLVSSNEGPWLCGSGPITGQGAFIVDYEQVSTQLSTNNLHQVTTEVGVIVVIFLVGLLIVVSQRRRTAPKDREIFAQMGTDGRICHDLTRRIQLSILR